MLATTKPQAAATIKITPRPRNCEEGAWTEFGCWRVERFLVHGIAALNDIGSVRSCVVSNSISLGKRFRDLKYIFEIPDGSLVWPAIPFERERASAAIESDELISAAGCHAVSGRLDLLNDNQYSQ